MDGRLMDYRKYGKNLYAMCKGVVGYLVPVIENGRMVERTLLRRADASHCGRPFAWAGFDMESGALLYYKHCMAEDFIDTGRYPSDAVLGKNYIDKRTAKQQMEYEKKLWEMYGQIRGFVFKKELTENEKNSLKEYMEQWKLTVLLDLIPYYEALSPEFFDWIRSVL